jgi:hypothetical protein
MVAASSFAVQEYSERVATLEGSFAMWIGGWADIKLIYHLNNVLDLYEDESESVPEESSSRTIRRMTVLSNKSIANRRAGSRK